jgi:hypothetical protein
VTFVLEACDEVDGPVEESVQENQTVSAMRPLSSDSPWDPHHVDGVSEIPNVDHASPRLVQLHSNELSPQPQIMASYHHSPPTTDGPSALSLREASLMRSFIQRIAPWVSRHSCVWKKNLASDAIHSPRRTIATLNAILAPTFPAGHYKSPCCSKQ